jgi:hypothetical protein
MAAALETLLARLTPAPRLTPTTISFKQASQISGLSESHFALFVERSRRTQI